MSLSDAAVEEALKSFEDFLREKRLKMTEQRRNMIRTALGQRGHFSAEDLYRRLNSTGESVSMATVYRGLALLEEAEMLDGHDFADGQRRYERALDREHHDHMICVDCKAVVEFTNDEIERLQEEVVATNGFTLKDHSLTLFVKCDAFRENEQCERRDEQLVRNKERAK